MQAKTERFEMRLDQKTLERVDGWRSGQEDLPSRAEAVRRLIERGLGEPSPEGLHFRDSERLILSVLCDVSRHLKIKDGIDPEFVTSALYGGHKWAVKREYCGIFPDREDAERTVSEVENVLEMWSFLERGYAKLSKKDKERVATEAERFGEEVRFLGFDANYENEHFGIALFLVNKLDDFTLFKGRELNSHFPVVDSYRKMLAVFEPMRKGLVRRELGATEIIEILEKNPHRQTKA